MNVSPRDALSWFHLVIVASARDSSLDAREGVVELPHIQGTDRLGEPPQRSLNLQPGTPCCLLHDARITVPWKTSPTMIAPTSGLVRPRTRRSDATQRCARDAAKHVLLHVHAGIDPHRTLLRTARLRATQMPAGRGEQRALRPHPHLHEAPRAALATAGPPHLVSGEPPAASRSPRRPPPPQGSASQANMAW